MEIFRKLFEPVIPAHQATRLAAIVAQKQSGGQAVTPAETAADVERLLRVLADTQNFEPAFKGRVPNRPRDVIESDLVNGNMEELALDLQTLYTITNQLTGTTIGMQKILHSKLEELRAKLCKISDEIIGFRKLKGSRGFSRIITQGFASGKNLSPAKLKAEVDPQTRTLKLKPLSRVRYHQRRGVNPSLVRIANLSAGLLGVASRTFEPDRAIDPDTDSFWAEVLLANQPISTTYAYVDGSTTTLPGAIAEVGLVLGAPEFVSDVKVLPFGDYPIDIIDVKFRQGQSWFQYPGFVDRDPSLNWLEWHGPRVQADEVAFVLHQRTYTRVKYHIPRSVLELSTVWEQLLDEEVNLTLGDNVLTTFQQQRAEADSHYASLYEAQRRYGAELERLDIPTPDTDGRTLPTAEVLRRQVDAVSKTLLSDPREPALRLRPVRNETDRAERNDLIEIERIEYVFGAREIQANDVNYNQVGAYASPQFSPASTVLQLQLDAVEEHPTFGTGAATYRQTSIEYDLEVAPGRRRAILPKGSTVVQDELLVLDQSTRQDTTRFKATGATGTLRKNGESVDPTMFTQVLLPDERIRVTISAAIFSQVARFSLTYTPKADQDKLDVEAEFDSVGLERPETFNGTNDRGEIELQFYPYVDYSIINDADAMNATPNFRREAERSADYFWVGGAEQVILDGRMFGAVNTALTNAITAADTTIGLNSTAAIPSAGSLKIGTELVTYTGKTATDITGVTRGTGGTTAQAHVVGLLIVAEQTYAPLVVNVGNIAAFNISDYLSGRHPAFLSTSEDALRYEYIQIGRKLFFNRPINNTPITVSYRWMTQYLQVFGLLRGHGAARVPSTPVLSRYHLEIESTVL